MRTTVTETYEVEFQKIPDDTPKAAQDTLVDTEDFIVDYVTGLYKFAEDIILGDDLPVILRIHQDAEQLYFTPDLELYAKKGLRERLKRHDPPENEPPGKTKDIITLSLTVRRQTMRF